MADLVDWADVAAVGVLIEGFAHPLYEYADALLDDSPYTADVRFAHAAIASALREAYESGAADGWDEGAECVLDEWPDEYDINPDRIYRGNPHRRARHA